MTDKSRLFEFCQKNGIIKPTFEFEERGEPHCRQFKCSIILQEVIHSNEEWYKSKKESENNNSRYVLQMLLGEKGGVDKNNDNNENIDQNNRLSVISNQIISESYSELSSISYIQEIQIYRQRYDLKDFIFEIKNNFILKENTNYFYGTLSFTIDSLPQCFTLENNEKYKTKKMAQYELAKMSCIWFAERGKEEKLLLEKRLTLPVDGYDETPVKVILKKDVRSYQEELFFEAIQKDVISYLPTGCGKTLISCLMVKRMHQKNPTKLIAFLVDRIPLVLQQAKVIEIETGLKTLGFYGGNFDKNKIDSSVNVIVIIAGLFINLLKVGTLSCKDFSLVVFDEAHHIVKNHPFSVSIRDYIRKEENIFQPRILGLTASPTGGVDFYDTFIKIKGMMKVTGLDIKMPVKSIEELEKHTNNHSINFVNLKNNHIDIIFQEILTILKKFYEFQGLEEDTEDTEDTEDISYETPKEVLYESIEELNDQYQNFGFCETTDKKRIEICPHLKKLISESNLPENLKDGLNKKINLMVECEEAYTKLGSLIEILNNTIQTIKDPRMIIFVKKKISAKMLLDILKPMYSDKGLIPALVTGHNSGGSSSFGMSPNKQLSAVKDFRENKCNLLIATSVIEEGFDVPQCNVVIRLDSPDTVTSLIQSRGRLRSFENKFYAIVKDFESYKYERLMKQEKMVKAVVRFIQLDEYPTDNILQINIDKMEKFDIQKLEEYRSKLFSFDLKLNVEIVEEGTQTLFTTFIKVNDLIVGVGQGTSKKKAKEKAATNALFEQQEFLKILRNL